MSVDIKIGLSHRPTRPATWADVVTEGLWTALAIVFAYPLIPMLVERNELGGSVAVLLSTAFGFVAFNHLAHAVRMARGLRKQRGDV